MDPPAKDENNTDLQRYTAMNQEGVPIAGPLAVPLVAVPIFVVTTTSVPIFVMPTSKS